MKRHWFWKGPKFALIGALFVAVVGVVVMSLWNWLMPMLFGLKIITYWQAFGLLVLAKLIFSGMGGGHLQHHGRHHFGRHHRPWSINDDSFQSPGGDRRNWVHYREYWKERGKKDFEAYLRETGRANDESATSHGA